MSRESNMEPDESRGHETSDAHFRSVVVSGIGLFGLIIFGLLVSLGLYAYLKKESADPGKHPDTFVEVKENAMPPKPRLQSDPHATLVVLRAAEDSALSSYGWVNRESGVARIPIGRAMEIIMKKGLPVRPKK
jgi:hypothetical protein